MDGSRLGIVRTIHQAADTGVNQCSRTHHARFNCSKQLAVAQSVIPEVSPSFTQGHDFGVGGGIAVGEVAVPASSDDAATMDDDGPDRDFASFESALRRAQGFFHPEFVRRTCVGVDFEWFRRRLVGRRQLRVTSGQSPEADCGLLRRVYANREPECRFRGCKPQSQISLINRSCMGSFVPSRPGLVKIIAVTWKPRLPFGYDGKPLYINCLAVVLQLKRQAQNGTPHAFPE